MLRRERHININKIDWSLVIYPMATILALCGVFYIYPQDANTVLQKIKFYFCDTLGAYYLIMGLGVFLLSIYLAFSKYGEIVLGPSGSKPQYPFFVWGSMMFTCGLAADILFYSFSEWIMYATDAKISSKADTLEWVGVYPIFHWSFIPWSFYLVLATAFGFMLHVKHRTRQKYSEACRPLLGKYILGVGGKIIDIIAVFALLAGTATTFSIATPLMAEIISRIIGIEINRTITTIVIIIVTCIVYTGSLLHGFKWISSLAKHCIYLTSALLFYVLLFGGESRTIIEIGLSSVGRMIQNFFELATYTDVSRKTSFPQNWTIYYWAYWMVWSVAVPFFIGNISKGRTIKDLIIGGYIFGITSTIMSFIILGNYSLAKQISGEYDVISAYTQNGDIYQIILSIIDTLPFPTIVLVGLLIIMISFYATSFDSIAYTASCYSYHELKYGKQPHKFIQFMWCIMLILLPIVLVFSESSMSNLQSVSIIAAFPVGIVMLIIIFSFFKDAKRFLK